MPLKELSHIHEGESYHFYDGRDRYDLTPDRYAEVTRITAVVKMFNNLGVQWRNDSTLINYLDVGCSDCKGTSGFSQFIGRATNLAVNAVGIDASSQCAPLCSKHNVQFICLDVDKGQIPFKNHFQIVTLFETIEHIFNTDLLLQSLHDAMAKDGVLLISTLNVVCWKNRILVPLGIQPLNTEVSTNKLSYGYRIDYLKRRVNRWKPAGHIRPFTLYSLQDMLIDNGFKVVNHFGLENWRPFKFLERMAINMCTGLLVVASPDK